MASHQACQPGGKRLTSPQAFPGNQPQASKQYTGHAIIKMSNPVLPMMRIPPIMTEPAKRQLIINFTEISKSVVTAQLVSAQCLNPRSHSPGVNLLRSWTTPRQGIPKRQHAMNTYHLCASKEGSKYCIWYFIVAVHHPDLMILKKTPLLRPAIWKRVAVQGLLYEHTAISQLLPEWENGLKSFG